jgi:glucosamine--fructose-6-phosphate aminotransferase (isomerizing)
MGDEARAAPEAVARQAAALRPAIAELVARLRRRPPDVVVTCARGSSAHAATFAKHLIERHLGIPVAAAAPGIASVYGRRLRLRWQLLLAVSQSGRSDDLIAMVRAARAEGALTAALVNETGSPMANACDIVLPVGAGPELSIAATKSFVASLSALLRLAAAWHGRSGMAAALERLPQRLAAAAALDWSAATAPLARGDSVAVLGRGPTLAIAREVALKLEETCRLPAEAFSGAEFLHGPVALASSTRPVLMLMPGDAAQRSMCEVAARLRRTRTPLLVAGLASAASVWLPVLAADHPDVDAVCLAQSSYFLALRLAAALGRDVDRPRQLDKVTRTR